jgi:hypothetical protein
VKTGSNLAVFSKEGYGSKGAVLPMIMKYRVSQEERSIF